MAVQFVLGVYSVQLNLLNNQLGAASLPDLPSPDKIGLGKVPGWLEAYVHFNAAQFRHC